MLESAVADSRWHRIDELFDSALALPEAERCELLDRECADDPDLRLAVERLLALESEADDFFSRTGQESTGEAEGEGEGEGDASDDLVGVRVGPYRLLRLLGHGGMGSVYLARREDDYRQEVAIKLVRRSLLGSEARHRLRVERQALAGLEHPNIARLYDGGTSDDGLPYLVMERVEGMPIDRYCDHHRLSVRRRLGLLMPVLAAVAHAHHHLRVHCDIKPSNILVTTDGTPKLLDFGIAKLLGPEARSEIHVTLTGLRPMTLAYASPEQVTGGAITTASDIYSLGVLLNHLVCGQLPYPNLGDPQLDLPRAIVEDDPERPSQRIETGRGLRQGQGSDSRDPTVAELRSTTPRELERALRGDLDAIVMKALRKEPSRRHRSVEALAQDVDDHLESRPVKAHSGSLRYRGSRFLRRLLWPPDSRRRRERWAWAAVLVVMLATSWSVLAMRRAPDPCRGAADRLTGIWDEEARSQVEAAFLATGLPFAQGTWSRVRSTLDRRATEWSDTRTELCQASHVRGDLSPRLLDLGQLCLDSRLDELNALVGLLRQADDDLVIEANRAVGQLSGLEECTDAAELATRALPPTDPELRRRFEEARRVVEEQSLRLRIKEPVDFERLRAAETEIRRLETPDLLSRALFVLGSAEGRDGGAPERGEALLEEALRAAIAGGNRPQQVRIYSALIKMLAHRQGDIERARFWAGFGRATLAALDPGHDQLEYELADAIGMLEYVDGNRDVAKTHFLRTLEIAKQGSDPVRWIRALNQLGLFDDPEPHLERAIALIEREFGPDHVLLAPPLVNLASQHAFANRYQEALPLAWRSLEVLRATHGPNHPDQAIPNTLIGQLLIAMDRPEEAVDRLQEARIGIAETMGPGTVLEGDVGVALGEALLLLGDLEKAEECLRQSGPLLEEALPPGHPSRLNLATVAGDLARESGDLERALKLHLGLRERLRESPSPHSQMKSLLAIGRTLVRAGRDALAVEVLEEALDAPRNGGGLAAAALIRFSLAQALWSTDRDRAVSLLDQAEKGLSDGLPLHRRIRDEVGDWRSQRGDSGETLTRARDPSNQPSAQAPDPVEDRLAVGALGEGSVLVANLFEPRGAEGVGNGVRGVAQQ